MGFFYCVLYVFPMFNRIVVESGGNERIQTGSWWSAAVRTTVEFVENNMQLCRIFAWLDVHQIQV